MNAKILTSVGCLLLLAAALSPSVLGHSERAALPNPDGTGPLPDNSGYAGAGTGIANSVSGRYVGAAGPAVAIEAYINPQGTLASGGMLCDAEVVVGSPSPSNEFRVDGAVGGGAPGSDFWDDGGQGGACHTHHYTHGPFNTFGCQAGTRAAGSTHTGADIWVGASCDWKTDQGGQQGEITLVLCLINTILATTPGNVVGQVGALTQCVTDYVNCLIGGLPGIGCVQGGTESCGADGSSDAIVYGYAGVGATLAPANFPTGFPVGWIQNPPAAPFLCPTPTADTAAVFVWDTVATNGLPSDPIPEVYLALTGEIWTAPGLPAPPALPPCPVAGPTNFPIGIQRDPTTGGVPCTAPNGQICRVFWYSVWDPVQLVARNVCI